MLNFTRYYLILGGAKVRFFSYIPKNDENIFVVYTFFNVFASFFFLTQYSDVNHVNK